MSRRNNHNRTLKQRFIEAIIKGELGYVEGENNIVTLKAFRNYFSDIKTQYVLSFMPAATIEPGWGRYSHTKFLYRLRKGVYQVHPQLINEHSAKPPN